jgi:hypothetical protein
MPVKLTAGIKARRNVFDRDPDWVSGKPKGGSLPVSRDNLVECTRQSTVDCPADEK